MFTMAHSRLIILLQLLTCGHSLRILGIFPTSEYSDLGFGLMSELAKRDHLVTFIAPYNKHVAIANFTLIHTDEYSDQQSDVNAIKAPSYEYSYFRQLYDIHKINYAATKALLEHSNVKELLERSETFDLVIVEHFVNNAVLGFCHYYKAACIEFVPITSSIHFSNPAYVPEMVSDQLPNDFRSRLQNTILHLTSKLFDYLYLKSIQNSLMQAHFPETPHLDELETKTKLYLLNSHATVTQAMSLFPNVIQVGGFHIKPEKNLPDKFKLYLDNSKNGVIYFNLGSHKSLPFGIQKIILKVFSKVNMNIIWNLDRIVSDLPPNVLVENWLPQNDILAHPNVKLFITDGEITSIIEAIHHAVPMIGLPLSATHLTDLLHSELKGVAIILKLDQLNEETFTWVLKKALNGTTMKENALKLSKVFHDRPLKPLDEAVYWIEYIAEHSDTNYLKPRISLAWYEYFNFDVGIVMMAMLSGFLCGVIIFFKVLIKKIFLKHVDENIQDVDKKTK